MKTIPDFFDYKLAWWQIQTQAFSDENMEYARGYSNSVEIPENMISQSAADFGD